jgi:hypothetical protein
MTARSMHRSDSFSRWISTLWKMMFTAPEEVRGAMYNHMQQLQRKASRLVARSHDTRHTPTGVVSEKMTLYVTTGSQTKEPLPTVIPPLHPIRRESAAQIRYPVTVAAAASSSSEEVVHCSTSIKNNRTRLNKQEKHG